MAKRTTVPPATEPDHARESLIHVTEILLSNYFFDPDNEQAYKLRLSRNRAAAPTSILLDEETIELEDSDCHVRIEALRTWTRFRVTLSHSDFEATVEGTWSFDNEELSQIKLSQTGEAAAIFAGAEALREQLEGGELDDEELTDLMAALEDDEDVPLIGDDPSEPPQATALDGSRLKAIAKRLVRRSQAELSIEDRGWLEQMPQTLPVITEALVDLTKAAKRDDAMIEAYQSLLTLQMEFVRYRQDRGWSWAGDMLEDLQRRLIELGGDEAIPREDWFAMCSALTQARVPISDATQTALANAGFKPDEDLGPPEEMMRTLHHFMDELARMVSSPFDVVRSLLDAGAMLPATLRQFIATELALSPHLVLRDAVPVMLLDDDAAVRRSAAAALEQIARPGTLSGDALRRAITLRNWIPPDNRPPLDAAIRKARSAGVEIGAWPPAVGDLVFHASPIDGSGAQSILIASRTGKKGFFGGLLLRHGTGVIDAWADTDLSRGKINKLLREAQMSAPHVTVDRTFVDTIVQHAIATAVAQDNAPPAMLLEIAEFVGGAEWKDRSIDIAAQAETMFASLDAGDRTQEGVEAGFARGVAWMAEDEVFATWYEDGPKVQEALAKLPRTDRDGMVNVVMTDLLPPTRAIWAERFLMMALLSQAGDAVQRARASDLVQVAHALTGDRPLSTIPIMRVIAVLTVRAALLGAW